MKTTIHLYHFDTRNPDERAAWRALKAQLKNGPHIMEAYHPTGALYYRPELDGLEIELETKFLFDNQWNTAPIPGISEKGLRVFDWAKDAETGIGSGAPRGIKRGYYLDQTDEMRHIRANTLKCGYCGKYEPAFSGLAFCPHCLDSEYLKEANLHLTRLLPVSAADTTRAPLTAAERAYLLPRYIEAQTRGSSERGRERLAAQRRDIEQNFTKATTNAKTERDGMVWLLDHGLRIDNVIYYHHTGKFSFGWRKPLDKAEMSRLREIIAEFPFPYQLVSADGNTVPPIPEKTS